MFWNRKVKPHLRMRYGLWEVMGSDIFSHDMMLARQWARDRNRDIHKKIRERDREIQNEIEVRSRLKTLIDIRHVYSSLPYGLGVFK